MKPSPLRPIGKAIVRIPQTYPHVYIAREPITEPIIHLDTESARPIPVKAVKKFVKQVPAPAVVPVVDLLRLLLAPPAPAVVPAPKKMMKKIGRAVEPGVDFIRAEQARGQIGEAVPIERGNRFMDMFQMAGGIPTSQYLNLSELPGLATSTPELATTIRALPEGLVKPRDKLDVYQWIPKGTKFVEELLKKGVLTLPFGGLSGGVFTSPERLKAIKQMGKSLPGLQHDVAKQQYTGTYDMSRGLTRAQSDENVDIMQLLNAVLGEFGHLTFFNRELEEILWSFDANNPNIFHDPKRPKRFWESDDEILRGNAPANMLRPPRFDFEFSYRKGTEMGVLIDQQKLEYRLDWVNGRTVFEYIEWKP